MKTFTEFLLESTNEVDIELLNNICRYTYAYVDDRGIKDSKKWDAIKYNITSAAGKYPGILYTNKSYSKDLYRGINFGNGNSNKIDNDKLIKQILSGYWLAVKQKDLSWTTNLEPDDEHDNFAGDSGDKPGLGIFLKYRPKKDEVVVDLANGEEIAEWIIQTLESHGEEDFVSDFIYWEDEIMLGIKDNTKLEIIKVYTPEDGVMSFNEFKMKYS